jgi:predicted  nucleic acid-binding Zn-ribbon protein
MLDKAAKMEEENADLQSQIDMVIAAKQGLEKTIVGERQKSAQLEERVKELEQALEEAEEKAKNATDDEKQSKLNEQINYLVDLVKFASEKSQVLQAQID